MVEGWNLPRVSVLAEAQPFEQVISDVASQCGLSVVCPEGLGKVTVSLEDADGERAIRELCRQVNAAVRLDGTMLVFQKGSSRGDTFGVWYRGQDEAAALVDVGHVVLGKDANIKAIGERVVVSGAREDVERMSQVLTHLAAAASDTWMLDISVVSVSRNVRREAGLDWSVAGSLKAGADASAGRLFAPGPVFGARAAASVGVLARCVEEGREAHALSNGSLLVVEGKKARFQQGESIPVPQRTVSPEGTVTVTGYNNVQTGFSLDVEAWRNGGGVTLHLTPRLSGVNGYNGEQPIVSERSVDSTVTVRSGEWVVVSGLEEGAFSRSFTGLPGFPARRLFAADQTNVEGRSTIVLLRATRVRRGSS